MYCLYKNSKNKTKNSVDFGTLPRTVMQLKQLIWNLPLLVLLPVILLSLLIFSVFKVFVWRYLVFKYGNRFIGFFDKYETVFSMGSAERGAVINIIVYFTANEQSNEGGGNDLLHDLRDRFKKVFMNGDGDVEKVLYHRQQYKLGFPFWLYENPGPIEKYVRTLDCGIKEGYVTESQVQRVFTQLLNEPLPDDHTRNIEVLVGNKALKMDDNRISYPVNASELYRVSHMFSHKLQKFIFPVLLHKIG